MSDNKTLELKTRYHTLDTFRGICVLGMVIYHTLFDIVFMFNIGVSAEAITAINIIRDFGAALFIFMSGFCFRFGKHHLRHILILNGAGLIISVVTYIFAKDMFVIFGILTFMGCACLIMCALDKLFRKAPPVFGFTVSILLFLLFFNVYNGYCGFGDIVLFRFPNFLYENYVTAFFGFPFQGFSSGDYFSIFPWIFAYFSGYFFSALSEGKQWFEKVSYIKIPFITRTGKLSMYIYIIHQPVVYGIVWIAALLTM